MAMDIIRSHNFKIIHVGTVSMILELNNITKLYPGVKALDNISLQIEEGEVHALVGENGAGKSTLIKTCTGAVIADEGEIKINGKAFKYMTPKLSQSKGIAVIYQEFNLVGELSVAENVFLGRAIKKGIFIDKQSMVKESEKIFEQFNIDIDVNELVSNLTVGYQQLVEIAKAISQDAKILIMDEPSAPLTKMEAERMYLVVDELKKRGVTIIYISHRMEEIFRLADRVTVMRDGKTVKTMPIEKTDVDEIVKLMVGREIKETYPGRKKCIKDEVILKLNNLSGNGIKDVSFEIKRGEILGLAGLIGSGRTELAELIFGVAKKESGQIIYRGEEINPKSPRDAIDKGIALIPEDRKKLGALLDIDIKGNISMPILKRISKIFFVNKNKEEEIANFYKDNINIKTPSLKQKVKNLSGGNQQKVIVAKWLASESDFIIFDEPTRGIDVGAKYDIYKLVNTLVENGKTILMISSEMPEVMGMSDRIIVLSEGRISGILEKREFEQERIMSLASNSKEMGN